MQLIPLCSGHLGWLVATNECWWLRVKRTIAALFERRATRDGAVTNAKANSKAKALATASSMMAEVMM